MSNTSEFEYKKYLNLVVNRRYLFVSIFLAVMSGAVFMAYYLPKEYDAECTVFIEKGVLNEIIKGIATEHNLGGDVKVLAYALKSRRLILTVLQEMDLIENEQKYAKVEATLKSFQERTSINFKDTDGLFTISFRHTNPRLARDYVNTLIRRYIDETVSSKRKDSIGATRFLSEQINNYKSKMEMAEEQVNSFKREKGGLLAETPAQLQLEIDNLSQKINEVVLKRDQLGAIQHLVAKQEDPLQVKLTRLQDRLTEISSQFTDEYPEIIELKSEIKHIKAQMNTRGRHVDQLSNTPELAKIKSEQKGLDEMERRFRQSIVEKQALQRNLPAALTALGELERNMNTQKSVYEQLVARYQQSEVSRQAEVQHKSLTFKVVDPAVTPIKPSSPNSQKILLLGLTYGLGGALAVLLLLDHFDSSVRTPEMVKSLGIPLLAVVQKIEDPEHQMISVRRDIWFFASSTIYFSLILAAFHFQPQ